MKLILHTSQLAEDQHYYPAIQQREHRQHNAATEGAFGAPWGTQ